jgi:hypothetical protein
MLYISGMLQTSTLLRGKESKVFHDEIKGKMSLARVCNRSPENSAANNMSAM